MGRPKNAQVVPANENPAPEKSEVEVLKEQNAALMAQMQEMMLQNQQLLTSLAITRGSKAVDEVGEPDVKIENVCDMHLIFKVHDPRNGQPQTVTLEKRGSFRLLYRRQVEELLEKHPHFFERGYVSCPELAADSPNVIRDPKAFIEGVDFATATERVNAITSLSTLYSLYHFIETSRWAHQDEKGNLYTEEIDGKKVPTLKERPLSGSYLAVELAVQRRIAELSNVNVSLNG